MVQQKAPDLLSLARTQGSLRTIQQSLNEEVCRTFEVRSIQQDISKASLFLQAAVEKLDRVIGEQSKKTSATHENTV